ncbi:HelD family protein, partial [Streptomyces alkaliphilus]|uniref:HelD family protein n=1 Tax=Streptomyces alkaliphilus TaxID=1472722 RepID=UPI003F6725BE
RAMRADAEALDIGDVTASWVTAEVLRGDVERRIAALADLADTARTSTEACSGMSATADSPSATDSSTGCLTGGATTDPPPGGDQSDALAVERAHLAASRAALRAMRADAEALDIGDVTASWVTAEVLRGDVERRIAALADLADTPLFFGRLDYLRPIHHEAGSGGAPGAPVDESGRRFHIGRRHVHDAHGDPMVIDWRAPVSQPFYRASPTDPQGVRMRRRFGYEGGELTALEDEHLGGPAAEPGDGSGGAAATGGNLLLREIERPRVGPMRDIVATIQPEQDEIVRAPLRGSLCVQGAPGTGKTAVGLHRVAYLLYAHRERLSRSGTLVIGPNRSFLRYIEQVLPALGELEVRQTTVDALVSAATGLEPRGTDDPAVARLKGDARMAEVLRRAVRSGVRMPEEALEVPRGARRWRVPAHEVADIVRELLERDIRYGAALEALPQRLAHAVLVRMERAGEAPDDRVQAAVARSAPVKAMVRRLWPAVDPAKLVLRLLSDPAFLAERAEGLLTPQEVELLPWPRPARGVRSAPWSPADAVLVDEVRDLVTRTPSLGHVVLDEAQDLSPMQYRAVGRRCSTGSVTVLGDLAQGTTPWATGTWAEAMAHLGKPEAAVAELTLGFRVPREIIAYASRLLPAIAPGLAEAGSVRRSPGSLRVRRVTAGELDAAVVAACGEALEREGSVGLIAADARLPALRAALVGAGHEPLG